MNKFELKLSNVVDDSCMDLWQYGCAWIRENGYGESVN